MKKYLVILLSLAMVFSLAACSSTNDTDNTTTAATTADTNADITANIMVAAAASLETVYTDTIIPMFNEIYPNITVTGTYDSSGKLQTQIEEGLAADVFMSAATKQMDALVAENLVNEADVVDLLVNKVVMIDAVAAPTGITSFADVLNADTIAVGDPASVPAGQYAQEIFTSLGIWDQVQAKASLGTNVTEVLNWVAAGSADVGIVYATDAATMTDKVEVIATDSADYLATPVIYPVAALANSANAEAAALFVQFLQSDDAIAAFEAAGFNSNL